MKIRNMFLAYQLMEAPSSMPPLVNHRREDFRWPERRILRINNTNMIKARKIIGNGPSVARISEDIQY